MNEADLIKLLAEEAAQAEATRDDPYPPGAKFTRRGQRTAPVSVRLSEAERASLELAATAQGVGVSTLARELITHGLTTGEAPVVSLDEFRKIVVEAVAPLRQRLDELSHAA